MAKAKVDLFAQAKKLAAQGTKGKADQRVAAKGGIEPPAPGKAQLRFVGYVELGKQVETYQGQVRERGKVQLVFELVNRKKHPPIETEDGSFPRRLKIELTESLSERATLFQLRRQMDPTDSVSHIAQMIGDGFLGKVFHHEFQAQGRDVVAARLKPKGGAYTIEPAVEEDDEGNVTALELPEALSEPHLFFWDTPTLEQWDSLYIEGEYEKGRSKNVIQQTLRRATNWEGSPAYLMLEADGRDEDEYSPLEPLIKAADEDEDEPKAKTKPKSVDKAVGNSKKSKPAPVEDDEDDEEEEPKPKPKKSKPAPVEDDEDEEEEEPKPKPKKSKPAPVEDDEDDEEEEPKPKPKKSKPAPVEDDEDEEEEPKPKPKKSKPAPVEDDEDEEEETPKPKTRSARLTGLLGDV
jgi:hypothetical protein